MRSIIKTVGIWFLIALQFLLIFFYISGLIHSYKKHSDKDFILSIVVIPWAIYRGVEGYYFHDKIYTKKNKEKKVTDWDRRLNNDIKTILILMNISANPDEQIDKVYTEIERFAEKIKDYPDDKMQYLMEGARTYILYNLSMGNDFMLLFDSIKSESGKVVYELILSNNTIELRNDLIVKYKIDDAFLATDVEVMNDFIKEIESYYINDVVFSLLKAQYEDVRNRIIDTYSQFFGKEFTE